MIQIQRLSFAYHKKTVLRDVSFHIEAGSLNALIGLNGVGKSTLFRCLTRQYPLCRGIVHVNGKDIGSYSYREYAQTVSFVPQVASMTQFDCIVRDYLAEGRTPHLPFSSAPGRKDYKIVAQVAEEIGISEFLGRNLLTLSAGQQQLMSLARALVQQTPILLLDEPMSELDLCNQAALLKTIQRLAKGGKTILFSTHDPDHALLLNCNVVLLKNGTVIDQGRADSCLSHENIQEIYGDAVALENTPHRNTCMLRITL